MHEPTNQTIELAEVEGQLDALVARVADRESRILLAQAGVPVAALVSADDLRRLERLDQERADRFRVIDEARASFADRPPEEIDREADRAVAELRTGVAATA